MIDKPCRGGAKGTKRICRYGADCRNIGKGCKFYHPSSSIGAGISNDAAKKPNPKPSEKNSHAPKRDRSKIQCRYGMDCRNTKCPFFHHPAAAPVSPRTPARGSSPNKLADAANGQSPHNRSPELSEDHNQPSEILHGAPEIISPLLNNNGKTNSAIANTRKATTKKKCRWGAGCRNKKCNFLHPGQQLDVNPRRRDTSTTAGGYPKPICTVLPHKFVPPGPGLKEYVSTRPAVHPILPPQETQKQPDSIRSVFHPPGLHLSSSNSEVRSPFHASTHFTMFPTVSNAPTSGFPDDDTRDRTPLYSKTRSLHSLAMVNRNGTQYCQPKGEALKEENPNIIHSEDQPPDADWLFEVLGLNVIDVDDLGELSQQKRISIEDVVEKPYCANTAKVDIAAISAKSILSHAVPNEKVCPTSKNGNSGRIPISDTAKPTKNVALEKPSKELVPEGELVKSRRAALELRFESQKNTNDLELLLSLLQTCRSKQCMIKNALEHSIQQSTGAGTCTELDETDVVALLELNDLLITSIAMADRASLHRSKKGEIEKEGVRTKQKNAIESITQKCAEGSRNEDDSPSKPVDASAKTTMKKIKPVVKAKAKKAWKKSATVPIDKPQKQEKKPAPEQRKSESSPDHDAIYPVQLGKEKMARMLEEARKQAAVARERKKSKKNKKFERFLKENEEAKERRAKSWSERIAKENDYVDLIQKLLVAEFLRQSKNKAMGLTAERVLSDSYASDVLSKECREAYHDIFEGVKCRVVVAGSVNKDLNGRQGTIRYWDREKGKFCVGLDTKKSPDSQVQFLIPETLDLLSYSRLPSRKSTVTCFDVEVTAFIIYGGVSLGFSFKLHKSHIIALGSAESTKIGLEIFCKTREKEEHQRKKDEEAEKVREEEDRKRRASRRARESKAWEQRKAQARRDKEEYEEFKRQTRGRGRSMFDFDDDDEDCQCPRCRLGDRFFSTGGSFFFNIGGIPFRVGFGGEDSDEDYFFDDEFDDRWEEQLAEEKEEENRKQAEILGVDPDADERTIKLVYHKMALQYHPDKWKHNSEHGMSRKEAENRFKFIQSAYDHLMSNFDD
mmetsp:Transcript_14616/g.35223  ORF Transcript_14616/g.35223 Transcript_14616/m.35223 type:complete len:1072 (-) Transcript_14616:251-3466(-)